MQGDMWKDNCGSSTISLAYHGKFHELTGNWQDVEWLGTFIWHTVYSTLLWALNHSHYSNFPLADAIQADKFAPESVEERNKVAQHHPCNL